jgi:hypothetical protein
MEKIIKLFGNNVPEPEVLEAEIKSYAEASNLALGYLKEISELLTYQPKYKSNYSDKLTECQKNAAYLIFLFKQYLSNTNLLKEVKTATKYLLWCCLYVPDLISALEIADYLDLYEQNVGTNK